MFRKAFQSSLLSILYSCGASPLELWGMEVKNGCIRRVTDEEVKSLALEIAGTNVATTYIYTPKDPKTVLAIGLPFLIMILDDKRMHRRFRISNFQSTTKVRPFCTSMPIGLAGGWNQIQFNLADFTRRAYGSNYIETTRMQVHANCRIRRIYFADRLYPEDELPEDYKLLFPAHRESRSRDNLSHEKKGGRSRGKISIEAVPPDEPPAFRADAEDLDDERARQTTPVISTEPSRTIVAPDGASRVQIEIDTTQSEGGESIDRETEYGSEIDGATTEEREETAEEREGPVVEDERIVSRIGEEQKVKEEEEEEGAEEENYEEAQFEISENEQASELQG